ncbi:MAG TPA: M20/M25/M40 family metallo-hydrolase [Candidatus Nanoarchaeia archaeon]|nr:M20/M25/M40 family metallo-hydrolase [Candidatus Nanoarchaeia archaeon]
MLPNLPQETEKEITELLSQLIKIDTSNPPGNETKAAQFLSQNLSAENFCCEIFESAPGRGSLITRLKGTGKKPRILLLSHLDVVPAQAKEWTEDPFGGAVKDGYVWGRGALDMKSMTAIEVTTLKMLKRNGIQLKGDVILAATADEEMGGLGGADYLLQQYPEKIFAEYVINEGGGNTIPTHQKTVYTVNTAEKGLLWFRVRAKGTAGHGSLPEAADNPIVRINQVIQKLVNFRFKVELVQTTRQLLRGLSDADSTLKPQMIRILEHPEESDAALADLDRTALAVADEIRPRLKMSITPTIVRGGYKENVIPSECEAVFDCRVLPGQTTTQAMEKVKELLIDVDLEKLSFETIQVQEPTESPVRTPLFEVMKEVLNDADPGCAVVPFLMAGGTDSRFFRRMGSTSYGFQPIRKENKIDMKPVRLEHGVDERISVENLVFGVSVLYETVKRFMA